MNPINPKKLLHSKWTAVNPTNKAKHFIVSKITFDEDDAVISCFIEAVMDKKPILINWLELKDDNNWKFGWL